MSYLKETDKFFNKTKNNIYEDSICFSLVRNRATTGPFHSCRDVFNERILEIYNKGKEIKTKLVVGVTGVSERQAQLALDMLNSLEDYIGFEKSNLRLGGTNQNNVTCYIFRGDKRWAHAPPMASLYTLIIRIGASSHKEGDSWEAALVTGANDKSQWWWAVRAIPVIKYRGVENIFCKRPADNFKSYSYGTVHSAGIMSYSQKGEYLKNDWVCPPDPAH